MPFGLVSILVTITKDKEWFTSVREYTIAPGLVNSTMNWAFYSCTNIKLRTAFKATFLCRENGELASLNYKKAGRSDQHSARTVKDAQSLKVGQSLENITLFNF
jgi:hypothetical protein